MSANSEVLITGQNGERVTIRRVTAIGPEGWFDTEVEVSVMVGVGSLEQASCREDLSRFARELQILHEQLNGEAILARLEPNLELMERGTLK